MLPQIGTGRHTRSGDTGIHPAAAGSAGCPGARSRVLHVSGRWDLECVLLWTNLSTVDYNELHEWIH